VAQQIYSHKFLDTVVNTPSGPIVFAPDPGYTMILRDIDVWCDATTAGGQLYWRSWFTAYVFWECVPPAAGGEAFFQWRGRQVFPHVPGQAQGLRVDNNGSGSTGFYVQASGYLLTQP
jgi:hypothetical protein